MNAIKHWETTVAGVLTIVGAICTSGLALLHNQPNLALGALTTGIPAGVGLIRAKDANKA